MTSMYIDQVQPELVADKAMLVDRLRADALEAGMSPEKADELLLTLPPNLKTARCFLDKLTGLWRYEFGEPLFLEAQKQQLWGAHMWVPVRYLRRGMTKFLGRVPSAKRQRYLKRLDVREKHLDVLSEMIPLLNLNDAITVDFEVVGRGQGNREIDWLLGPVGGRDILFDVKSRFVDLIQQMDQNVEGNESPEPGHDAGLLFKSLEHKFESVDSRARLQGAWLATHIRAILF